MYVSIRKYKVKAGAMDELMSVVREGFVPIIAKAEGFVAYSAIRQDDHTLVTVSTFRDRAGADRSNLMAASFIREKNLGRIIPDSPEVIGGEAEIHQWSGTGPTTLQR